MKTLKRWTFTIFMLLIANGLLAQSDTILIEFGSSSQTSPEPWNNLIDGAGAGQIEIEVFDYTGRKVGYVDELISAAGCHDINLTNNQIYSVQSLFIAVVRIEDTNGVVQSAMKLVRTN